jgi:photosystem II stability/assembly factor-like uncharacterized protein
MKKIIPVFIILFQFYIVSDLFSQNIWQWKRGPISGDISDFITDNSGNLWISTLDSYNRVHIGGILRTTNNGLSWLEVYTATFSVYSMSKTPNGVFYISVSSHGILKSTNNGQNWVYGNSEYVPRKLICMTNQDIIGTLGSGMLLTTNSGINWNIILSNIVINDIKLYDNILYAAGNNGKIYKSSNNGSTWDSTTVSSKPGSVLYRSDTGVLYLGTKGDKLYNSTNSGNSWTRILTPFDTVHTVFQIENDNFLISSEAGLHRVSNFSNYTLLENKIDYVKTIYKFNNEIYLGTFDGIFKYTSSNNDIKSFAFPYSYCVKINIDTLGNIYAITHFDDSFYKSILWKSTNDGQNWSICYKEDINSRFGDVVTIGPNLVLIGKHNGISRSIDSGKSWTHIPLPVNAFVYEILRKNNNEIYAATSQGVVKSTNLGMNWTMLNNLNRDVWEITFGSGNSLFAGTIFGEVLRTTNDGANWQLTFQNSIIEVLYTAPNGNIYLNSQGESLRRSTNNGDSWQLLGLEANGVSDVLVNSVGYIFAAFDKVYISKNNGVSFSEYNTNIGGAPIADLCFDRFEFMWAASTSFGAMKTNVITNESTNSVLLPRSFSMKSYPNPFNPATTIELQIPYTTQIKISIYDINGKELDILINKNMPAGTHNINWNAVNYPSGIYFCKLITDEYSITEKLLLVK